jgi:hypothetical protein
MTTDPTSLDRLHDIVLPPATPWWPPAPGWLWVLGAVAVLALIALLRLIIHRQQNRYRREALAELKEFEGAQSADLTVQLAGMAALLKRTAMTAYSRDRVAALGGNDWFAFLDATGGTRFSAGLGAALNEANYVTRAAGWDEAQTRQLAAEIHRWIRHHVPANKLPLSALPEDGDRQAAGVPAQAEAA